MSLVEQLGEAGVEGDGGGGNAEPAADLVHARRVGALGEEEEGDGEEQQQQLRGQNTECVSRLREAASRPDLRL